MVAAAVETGRNTVITLDDDDSLTLTGVRLRNFDEDGFVLVA